MKILDKLNFCRNTTKSGFLEFKICICAPEKTWNAMSRMVFYASGVCIYHTYMYETLSMQQCSAGHVSGMVVTSLEVQIKKMA